LLIHDYLLAVDGVEVALLQMESGQRGYVITGDAPYLSPYEEGRREIAGALANLARFDPVAMGLPAPKLPILALISDEAAELEQIVALLRGGRPDPPQIQSPRAGGGRNLAALRHDEIDDLRRQAAALVKVQQRDNSLEADMTVGLIIAGLMLSGVLAARSVVLLRREIAARRTVETALRERQAALARSNGELEQFAHIASHDLQEPLRMISSYTQLLRRRYIGKLDADADAFIGYAVDGTKRMQVLINDLLNFSRVTSGAKPMEPVDLEAALDDTLKDLEIRIEDCGAAVTHDPLPTVTADPVQIRQLLLNLIANGMKFQPPARKPEVRVSATREGDGWRFGVRDNGIGIDPQYVKNLFQIFKRLHSSDEYPGTGIGLAVCKKIVERHGGQIWLESQNGQGSTFHFTLPIEDSIHEQ
jgi:signal transduction histidine kinase